MIRTFSGTTGEHPIAGLDSSVCGSRENQASAFDARDAHDGPLAIRNTCATCSRKVAWAWMEFEEIPAPLLYSALRLRQEIFIVEQSVPYPDIDGKDLQSRHLFGVIQGQLVAYLRVLPCGLFEPGHLSFGRVVVEKGARGSGLGRAIVKKCIDHLDRGEKKTPIKISSQLYLREFYSSFGFEALGEPYIEDRIPHIAMIRR